MVLAVELNPFMCHAFQDTSVSVRCYMQSCSCQRQVLCPWEDHTNNRQPYNNYPLSLDSPATTSSSELVSSSSSIPPRWIVRPGGGLQYCSPPRREPCSCCCVSHCCHTRCSCAHLACIGCGLGCLGEAGSSSTPYTTTVSNMSPIRTSSTLSMVIQYLWKHLRHLQCNLEN